MIRSPKRRGRVRLRSASSQLPTLGPPPRWYWIPCVNIKKIARYLVCVLVLVVVLSLNNIALHYVQTSIRDQGPGKLPTTKRIDVLLLPTKLEKPTPGPNPVKLRVHDEPEIRLPLTPRVRPKILPPSTLGARPKILPPLTPRVRPKILLPSIPRARPKILPPSTPGARQPTPGIATKKNLLQESERIFESEEDRTTPNELLQKSAIILVNTQSSCQVKQVLSNFRKDYADIPIAMAFSVHTREYCGRRNNRTMCLKIPDYSCFGETRECGSNELIKLALQEFGDFGYIFVWDAQLIYTESHSLALIAKRFVETRAKIVSPCIKELCNVTTGSLHLSTSTAELTSLPGIYPLSNLSTKARTCHLTEIFPPVFLTTYQMMASQHWDGDIHAGQHANFMLQVRQQKLAVAICKDLEVTFAGTCPGEHPINSFFADTWLRLSVNGFKQWGIKKIYNGLGKTFQPISGEITSTNTQWKSMSTHQTSKHSLDEEILQTVIGHINDQSPGWENVRRVAESNNTKLSYMYISPCVVKVEGSIEVEYDRHSEFKNKQVKRDIHLHTLNRTCDMFQDYWRLSKFGKLQRRQVYYVTAVSNDTEYMTRLLLSIASQRDSHHTNLVIVDMGRPGPDQFNVTIYRDLPIPIHYLHLGAPFSRSIGLRKGFDFALQVAESMNHKNPILFAIDTSMSIPRDFTKRVWRSTRCGVSVYAPICYKEKSTGGYWSQFGYGMIGTCASDYQRSGGWDAKWGYHWGAEDVDLMHRLQDDLPYTVRIRESDYRHSRVENVLKYTKPYYQNKNVYPLPLPITPLTRNVTDSALISSLSIYATKQMKYPIQLELFTVYETTLLPQHSGVMYDLRFRNGNNEEYYALVQSL